jgi:hypothetical protein
MSNFRTIVRAAIALLACAGPVAAQGIYPPPTAAPDLQFEVAGTVNAIVAFESGGQQFYLIGGDFNRVADQPRGNLALLDAAGQLADAGFGAAWAAGTDGPVHALALDGPAVIAGGAFTSAGGQPRGRLARFSLATGTLDAGFAPAVNGAVFALALDGLGHVYAGGAFSAVDGMARNRSAKLSLADGSVVAGWQPGYANANSVRALQYDSNGSADVAEHRLYAGGALSATNGGHNRAVVRLLAASGARDESWTANVRAQGGAIVHTILVAVDHVYVGGTFRSVGGGARNRRNIARLGRSDGSLDPTWAPEADGPVLALRQAADGQLLAVGDFLAIGGADRIRIAKLDETAGTASPAFAAAADRRIQAVAVDAAGRVLVGGAFSSVDGQGKVGVARLAAATGALDSGFDAGTGGVGEAFAFVADGSGGYVVGGSFDRVRASGSPTAFVRRNLLRLRPDLSIDPDWQVDVAGDVLALARSGSLLYVGGRFDRAGGQPRLRLARFTLDPATAAATLTPFNPGADGEVRVLLADPAGVYVAGDFAQLGGLPRNEVGQVGAAGTSTAFNPDPDDLVHAIARSGTAVYLGGEFTAPRAGLARVDAATGAADPGFDIGIDGDGAVRALLVSGPTLHVGGSFTSIGGQPIARLARVATGTATVDAGWAPWTGGNGTVRTLAADGAGTLYVGGEFTAAGSLARNNLARVSGTAIEPGWRPGSDGPVRQLGMAGAGQVLVAGAFAQATGQPRSRLAALPVVGSTVTSLMLSAPATVTIGSTVQVGIATTNIPQGATVDISGGGGCTITVAANGGSCLLSFPNLGSVQLVASYAGTPEILPAQDSAEVVVTRIPTSIEVTATPPDPTVGDPVQLGFATSGIPDGSTLAVTGAPGCASVVVNAGAAGCGTGYPDGGTYTVTATFAQTATLAGSSASVVVDVARFPTALDLMLTPSTADVDESITIDIVAMLPPGAVVLIGNAPGCASITLPATSCTTSYPAVGQYLVTASFPQTGQHDGAFAQALASIGKAPTAIALVATPAAVELGQQVLLIASTDNIPDGDVLAVTGAPGCSEITVQASTGSCTAVFEAVGTATVTASYAETEDRFGSSDSVDVAVLPTEADLVLRLPVTRSVRHPATGLERVEFSVLADNLGPADVAGAALDADVDEAAFAVVGWSCEPAAACSPASGTGAPSTAITLAAGTGLALQLVADRLPQAPAGAPTLAQVQLPAERSDPVPGNNEARVVYQPCHANLLTGPLDGAPPLLAHPCVFRAGHESP